MKVDGLRKEQRDELMIEAYMRFINALADASIKRPVSPPKIEIGPRVSVMYFPKSYLTVPLSLSGRYAENPTVENKK